MRSKGPLTKNTRFDGDKYRIDEADMTFRRLKVAITVIVAPQEGGEMRYTGVIYVDQHRDLRSSDRPGGGICKDTMQSKLSC